MRRVPMLAMLLSVACGPRAFDAALQTAHDIATRAVATEQAITATCEAMIAAHQPGALERCERAYDAYDRCADAMDALLLVLERAKAADAPDESELLRAALDAERAMRELTAALRDLGGDA